MSLFLRIVGQLFLILVGYAIASLAASAFVHLIFLGASGFDAEEARWIAAGSLFVSVPIVALFVAYFAFMPATIAIGIGEILGARDWLYYAIAGGAVGASVVALFWFYEPPPSGFEPDSTPFRDPMLESPYVLFTLIGAGLLGGIAYWTVAGRLAGGWKTQHPPSSRL